MARAPRPPTDAAWLDDREQHLWRLVIAFTAGLLEQLDTQLQADAGMPHAYYAVLAVLSEAPERTLRMNELARTTLSSPSRLSHAVRRLEDRGWVRRTDCPDDGRGTLAVLTDAGYAAVEAAAPGHVATVRRLLFDRLSAPQQRQLDALLTALVAPAG